MNSTHSIRRNRHSMGWWVRANSPRTHLLLQNDEGQWWACSDTGLTFRRMGRPDRFTDGKTLDDTTEKCAVCRMNSNVTRPAAGMMR